MNDNLVKKTEEWMQLERKTLAQRKVAEEFYYNNLMTLIESDYIERNKASVGEKAKYFITSAGTSYEPVVLNIKLFDPDRILFLYTKKTEDTLNQIVDYTGIPPDSYEKRQVSEIDPLDIYREIKHSYLKWSSQKKYTLISLGAQKPCLPQQQWLVHLLMCSWYMLEQMIT